MVEKEFERIENIREVAEKLRLGRRRFLKRLAVVASLGALGVLTRKAEAWTPPCGGGCDSCDGHICPGSDTCDTHICSTNTCYAHQCSSYDKCNQDTCEHWDECTSLDRCSHDRCEHEDQCGVTNVCHTNACDADICDVDICDIDDSCGINTCRVDIDCSLGDVSCMPTNNTCTED